jgi:pyruvate-ferredoxin/flavodoxin oxidoreductase
LPLEKYIYNETRYTMLAHSHPEAAKKLLERAQENVNARWKQYEELAGLNGGKNGKGEAPP